MRGNLKRRITGFVFIVVICSFASQSLAVEFAGGTGEPNDPYQIATAEQLISIGSNANLLYKHFMLVNDIDLDPNLPGRKVFDRAVIAPDVNSVPWRFNGTPFTGVFDGNGHTISNICYTSENSYYAGLFGYVNGANSEIKNLGLIDPNIDAEVEYYVGSLVARIEQGTITDCYVRGGNVYGQLYFGDFEYRDFGGGSSIVGGLIGRISDVSIRDCHVIDCNVFGGFIAGGLVGFSEGTITGCSSSGWISGNNCVGGLLGENEGEVIRCYSTGIVSAIDSYVGGLVGISTGIITHSYAMGDTSGDRIVGGLIGRNGLMQDWDLVWEFPGYISNCYSTGKVSGNSLIGGLVGLQQVGPITSSFWDIQTSEVNKIGGGIGLTTVEMMDTEFYSLNGWAGDPNWVLDIGKDYPRLAWEGTTGEIIPEREIDWFEGNGSPDNPYIIASADQLAFIGKANFLWDKNFVLISDLDLTDINILPIGDRSNVGISFIGSFDGNGHVIRNMTMGTEGFQVYYVGLFGHIGNGGIVRNLGLEKFQIIGSDFSYYVGGMAGTNDGTIDHCYTTGNIVCVNGSKYLAGFVGCNGHFYTKGEGTIINCYSVANVSSGDESWAIGGFVGANDGGRIANSYITGSISAGDFCYGLGGFAGFNSDEIVHCYAAGNVYTTSAYYIGGFVASGRSENVIDSFWDIEVSGQTYSDGGDGKTTAQMQTANTFLEASWDFEDIWMICEGVDYPRLKWQNIQCEEYSKPSDSPGLKRLTNNEAYESSPCWSPDGQKIAFTSERDGNYEIYVMNVDGSQQKNLTNNPASDGSPCWSPDGQKIAFTSGRDGLGDIYVMNADGSQQTRLTSIPPSAGEPSWSPDGLKIAFKSLIDMRGDIFVMNSDGSEKKNLTNNPAIDSDPCWSPDGQKIAFSSNRDGNSEIYVMNADGSEQTRITITNILFSDYSPCWSPDGQRIAFVSNEWNGDCHICLMNADGSEQKIFTTNPVSAGSPSWSPDGLKIAFDSYYTFGNLEIYVMNVE